MSAIVLSFNESDFQPKNLNLEPISYVLINYNTPEEKQ